MSNLRIKIVATEVTVVPTDKGSYQSLEITYKNLDFGDKVETKKIMSFTNKAVFATLKDAESGTIYTITRNKNDKGYWDWTAVAEGENAPTQGQAKPSATTPARSTYETPEERAAKQVYIVRQSSINAAIETLRTDKKGPSKEEVIEVAKFYEQWVFGNLQEGKAATPTPKVALPAADVEDDDVPY